MYNNKCISTDAAALVLPVRPMTPLAPLDQERALPPDPIPPKPPESYKPEEPHVFEKPNYLPKPIPHSPIISPSSIPIPSPSVSTNKHMELGYPNYGGYLYSIPGYSAFQPVSYPGMPQPSQPPPPSEAPTSEFVQFPTVSKDTNITTTDEEKVMDTDQTEVGNVTPKEIQKAQTDFEEHFTPEIIPASSTPEDTNIHNTESKMSITSLAQGSGATVTIPAQIPNKEVKKKPERFSLKTSIPISKIDMKCVSTPPDAAFQNSLAKKSFNPTFAKEIPRVEIQSNIVIKTATKEPEGQEASTSGPSNNINTLINAAEAINKTDNQFRKPEPKVDALAEAKEPPAIPRPIFNSGNMEPSKANFNKPPETSYNDQKNQIVLIQNKNSTNPKMLVTIQQQNPQVLLQRTNFDSKNLQAPSRLSSQSKKCKEDVVSEGTSSKVVALKRLHQENCDENDFENLITENQIYGNKIVVKEKSQGTLQEQDLKNKKVTEKVSPTEAKNVVLQPNFLYLSNVQFPGNLMMIKNNTKVTQTSDCNKTKAAPNENKVQNEVPSLPTADASSENKTPKANATAVSKEVHVLKSNNNVIQSLSNKTKPDLVFQSNQKVIMNSQIVYKVPISVSSIVEGEKINQPIANRDYPTFVSPIKEFAKQFEQSKPKDKLFIACPYQMDSKLKPKIVITNIRPKITRLEEDSALDMYEKRKRWRRLKYLSNRDKDVKTDAKKTQNDLRNVITPDKVRNEIYKEFANNKVGTDEGSSGSDTDDYGEEELRTYEDIIEEYGTKAANRKEKVEFMATLRLATLETYKEKDLELQDKVLRHDSVAAAYAAVGRLDVFLNVKPKEATDAEDAAGQPPPSDSTVEDDASVHRKKLFLSKLNLTHVTLQYKEDYEKVWNEILKERTRRNSNTDDDENQGNSGSLGFDPNCQLRLLTEIKNSVNENNNLIKKRLDSVTNADANDESIRVLAEKNFSELNRLSKMADNSVKLFKIPNSRKRDLNPGFDSENIKKPCVKVEQPYKNYPKIKIPSVSQIISLKSTQECQTVTSTQATSMDEPQNSAAGLKEMFEESTSHGNTRDVSCQVEEPTWPEVEALAKSYKEYDAARRREITDLHKRNTRLRVDGAHITQAASRESDKARALLAERQNLSVEENNLRLSLQRLQQAIQVIRNY